MTIQERDTFLTDI